MKNYLNESIEKFPLFNFKVFFKTQTQNKKSLQETVIEKKRKRKEGSKTYQYSYP